MKNNEIYPMGSILVVTCTNYEFSDEIPNPDHCIWWQSGEIPCLHPEYKGKISPCKKAENINKALTDA